MGHGQLMAALDIGSDTVHLLLARVEGSARRPRLARVAQHGELVELGRRVARQGEIGPVVERRLARLLRRYARLARAAGADRILLAATEACREAADGTAVLERLADAAGQPVRLLSGTREAELGFTAVAPSLAPRGAQLVIDSGGASTEVSLTDGRQRVASASIPVGAAALAAALPGDPPDPVAWALLAGRVVAHLGALPPGRPRAALATGGTAHNLAGLERSGAVATPRTLARVDLAGLALELLTTRAAHLAHHSGEDPRRVALLAPGLLIVAAIHDHYELDACRVVPEGVREGMILAALADPDGWWRDRPAAPST